MKNLNLETIKSEYKLFSEYIQLSHSILQYLITYINNFLYCYCKTVNYDEDSVCQLINNLVYLENFYFYIDKIAEEIQYISLEKLKLSKLQIKKYDK